MSPREIIDHTLVASGWAGIEQLEKERWFDCQPDFESSHYLNGFANPDGKFRFMPNWRELKPAGFVSEDRLAAMPRLPDHWAVIEESNEECPYRLVTAPARHYLNSSFTETPTSIRREGRPTVKIHPEDLAALGAADGERLRMGNRRGELVIHSETFDGVQRGVVIVESVWPNHAFEGGVGINVLTGADAVAPVGGAPFHDNHVWIAKA